MAAAWGQCKQTSGPTPYESSLPGARRSQPLTHFGQRSSYGTDPRRLSAGLTGREKLHKARPCPRPFSRRGWGVLLSSGIFPQPAFGQQTIARRQPSYPGWWQPPAFHRYRSRARWNSNRRRRPGAIHPWPRRFLPDGPILPVRQNEAGEEVFILSGSLALLQGTVITS